MTLAGLALVCAYLTKTIPELIGGMVSGTSMGGGSAIGGMAAAGAAGAAAAIAAVTTAGAAAPAATGALGTLSSGSAGTVGSNGLAGAINASFANASPSGGSTPLTGDFAGIGTSTGGSSATKAASPPGVGGFASNIDSAPTSSDVQRTAKQTGKAGQNSNGEEHKATPKGVGVSSGNSLSQATNGATKMLGVMMSITVPGMENAHGLSLNAASRSNALAEANTSTIPVDAELAVEPLTAESNVIRPASNTNTASGHLASIEVPGMTLKDDQQEKQS